MKKVLAIGMLVLVLGELIFASYNMGEDGASDMLIPRGPIRISSDSDFDSIHGVVKGNGTASNPYIIENYNIEGTRGYCIYIENTSSYFIIRDCYLHDAMRTYGNGFWNAGIVMYNVIHGKLMNNKVSRNAYGIYLQDSHNNELMDNNVTDNRCGIALYKSGHNRLINNSMNYNNKGLWVFSYELEDFNNSIDTTNTVDSYPVYYFFNHDGLNLDGIEAGHITVAGSKNITIRNIKMEMGDGIWIRFVRNCLIENLDISNTFIGIVTHISDNITIRNSRISNTKGERVASIQLQYTTNSIIENVTVRNSVDSGILLGWSSNYNMVKNSTFSENTYEGIDILFSNHTTVTNNNVSDNFWGIYLNSSMKNLITNNTISNNHYGLYLNNSAMNIIYHNNFMDNRYQAYDNTGRNRWNASYPTGGNYWSDYRGVDRYSGLSQNISGSDGIGDRPYIIKGYNGTEDSYPLMHPIENIGNKGSGYEGILWIASAILIFFVLILLVIVVKREKPGVRVQHTELEAQKTDTYGDTEPPDPVNPEENPPEEP